MNHPDVVHGARADPRPGTDAVNALARPSRNRAATRQPDAVANAGVSISSPGAERDDSRREPNDHGSHHMHQLVSNSRFSQAKLRAER
jgi:hypothetical protein